MKTKIIPIQQAICEEKYYPRNQVDWMTVVRYQKSKEAGAKFPPITVAEFKGKLIVVDGFHRLDAFKKCKETHIEVEILENLDEEQIFIESVKRNIGHGRQFSSQERVNIIITLEKWNVGQEKISEIIRIPLDELKPFVAKRITRITETSEEFALKSPLRHLAGKDIGDLSGMQPLANRTQIQIIDSLINLIKNNWIDNTSETIMEKLKKLKELLNDYIAQLSEAESSNVKRSEVL